MNKFEKLVDKINNINLKNMKTTEILQILKQIFNLTPEAEKVIIEKLSQLSEEKEKELMETLVDYTTKQNALLNELNKTLIKGKNELSEIAEDSTWESADEIIAKIK